MGKWTFCALVAVPCLILDQLTKLAAFYRLEPVGRINVISGFFDLTYVMNTGVSFGMMGGDRSFWRIALLVGIALVALAVVFYFIITADNREKAFLTGLALVLGGAVGNLIDRIRLGAVIDFLDFYIGSWHWPAFNVADIGICVGTGFIMLHLWRSRHREE